MIFSFGIYINKIAYQDDRMNKLNFLGIGPKMAVILLPWLACSIVLSTVNTGTFRYTGEHSLILTIAGVVLMAGGLIFYFSTVRLLLKGLRETILVTSGPYKICQNPLYSAIILFRCPDPDEPGCLKKKQAHG